MVFEVSCLQQMITETHNCRSAVDNNNYRCTVCRQVSLCLPT